MRGHGAVELIRGWAIALGGGLLGSLIAHLAHAHLVLALSIGVAACILVAVALSSWRTRRRSRLVIGIQGTPLWTPLNQSFWIVAAMVEAKNRTGATIGIQGAELTCEGSASAIGNEDLSDEVARAVARIASSDHYFPPLSGFSEIPAHRSISGWFVAAVRRNPAGGTPMCIITLKDEIDSQYKVIIPAQEVQIHWTSRHHLGQWRQYL
jgi:hypothetical protein